MLAAEALLATSGIFPSDPLTPEQGKEAEGLAKEWSAKVAEFLDQAKPAKFRPCPKVDHAKTLDALVRETDPLELQSLTAALSDDTLRREYESLLADAREFLRARWPALSIDTPTGPRLLEPGIVERGRSASLYAVVNKPARVLDEILMGTLTTEQADAFKAVFPGLSKMLRSMIGAELTKRAAKKSYSVPWRIERVLRVLLNLPPGVTMERIEQPPPKSASQAVKISFDRSRTKTQAWEARESGLTG